VSEGVTKEIKRCFPALAERSITIPNAVDHDAFRPPSPMERARIRDDLGVDAGRRVALFVGSEWERKGLNVAIETVGRRPEWDLLVVGSGDQDAYKGLAAACGAAERVRFAGRIRDTIPFYQAADAFLLPSAYEAFSLAMLEAASCGLPLLATRVSGAEDLLQDGINGWFITQDASDIALRLSALAADRARGAAMGAAAREASARFSWEATARSYVALYARIAGSRGPAASEPVRTPK
jgi:UDP-glucose:(heptosyl)LPS alpha-1,3-glucosyltransferase